MKQFLDNAHNEYCASIRRAIRIKDAGLITADKSYRETYSHFSVKMLKTLAKKHGFKGYSKMKKADLINLFAEVNEFTTQVNRDYNDRAYLAAVVMNQANEFASNSVTNTGRKVLENLINKI